jgi:transposase
MRWTRERQQELFSYSDIEKLVPENHLLRFIDRYVDFRFIYDLVDPLYSDSTGRPAWDPQLVLRLFLLGYLYNLSERRLVDEASMHAAYRWFLGLTFSDPLPDRTTLVKIRTEKWVKIGAFDQILGRVVSQCVQAGLVKGRHLTVDGTQIVANASVKSLEPLVVSYTPEEYLDELRREDVPALPPESIPFPDSPDKPAPRSTHPEDKNFRGEKLTNQTHRSRTDPDARLFRKSNGQDAALSFIGSYVADTQSRVILAVGAGTPGIHTESGMALDMLDSLEDRGMRDPVRILTADAHYGNTEFLCALSDRNITPHTPLLFGAAPEKLPTWIRPAANTEQFRKRQRRIREVKVRNQARETIQTTGYRVSQKLRKRSEHLFAEAKVCHGLRRARARGLTRVREQLACTATVQNIKRLVSFCLRRDRTAAAKRITVSSLLASAPFVASAVSLFRSSLFRRLDFRRPPVYLHSFSA